MYFWSFFRVMVKYYGLADSYFQLYELMITKRNSSPIKNSRELAELESRISPRNSPIRNRNKNHSFQDFLRFLNNNFMKFVMNIFIILILVLFILFYIKLRKEKKDEIETLKNSTSPIQRECQEKYEINGCDKISQNSKNIPRLVKICEQFDKCSNEKINIPLLSELIISHIGSLTEEFIDVLNLQSIFAIFTFLCIIILIDSIRNRPKIVL